MALYVYYLGSGQLHSWSPNDSDPVAEETVLQAKGLRAVTGLPPLGPGYVWQTSPPTVVAVTPPPERLPITTANWIMRLTPQELAAIRASVDPVVQQFIYALSHTTEIDLSWPMIVVGVAHLTQHPSDRPLLAPARVTAILAAATAAER